MERKENHSLFACFCGRREIISGNYLHEYALCEPKPNEDRVPGRIRGGDADQHGEVEGGQHDGPPSELVRQVAEHQAASHHAAEVDRGGQRGEVGIAANQIPLLYRSNYFLRNLITSIPYLKS